MTNERFPRTGKQEPYKKVAFEDERRKVEKS